MPHGKFVTDGTAGGGYLAITDFTTTNADFDLRADIEPIGTWESDERIWHMGDTIILLLDSAGTGQFRVFWRDAAVVSQNVRSANHGLSSNTRTQVRVTVDVDDGSGNTDIVFYTRADTSLDLSDDSGWTTLSSHEVAGVTGLRDAHGGDNLFMLSTSSALDFEGETYQLYLLNSATEYKVDLRHLTSAEVAAAQFDEDNGTTVVINGATWTYVTSRDRLLLLGVP